LGLSLFRGVKSLKMDLTKNKCSLTNISEGIKISRDGKIVFSEWDHKYVYLETGKPLTSSTTLLKKFKQPFNTDLVAKRYAKKHGRDPEEVKNEWKKKGDDASTKGTYIHKILEDLASGKDVKLTGRYPEEKSAMRFYEDFYKSGIWKPVALEEILWSPVGLSGQADAIVENKHGDIYLIDYKTSKKIGRESEYNNKMLHEFKHLDDCEYNAYSLQLSLYKMMSTTFPVKDIIIVHIRPDGYSLEHAIDFKCTEEQVKKWLAL